MRTAVINNTPGPIMVQAQPIGTDVSGRPIPGPLYQFHEGLNLIDSKTLKDLREKNAHFDKFFKITIPMTKAYMEVNPKGVGKNYLEVSGKELPDQNPLEKLADNEAIALVGEVKNGDILMEWLAGERRQSVRSAIERQAEELGASIDKKAKTA